MATNPIQMNVVFEFLSNEDLNELLVLNEILANLGIVYSKWNTLAIGRSTECRCFIDRLHTLGMINHTKQKEFYRVHIKHGVVE